MNLFNLFTDTEYRGQALALALERGGVAVLGVIIFLVGVAFVLANTKAADTVKDLVTESADEIVGAVVTKGKNVTAKVAS
jgi:hypothetical protein